MQPRSLARLGLIAVSALLVAALLATGWSTRRSILAAEELLVRAQADTLHQAVADRLRDSRRPIEAEDLERALARFEAAGVRLLLLLDPRGSVIASAGDEGAAGRLDAPLEGMERRGDRIRMARPLAGPAPPPPPVPRGPQWRRLPPRDQDWGPPPPPRRDQDWGRPPPPRDQEWGRPPPPPPRDQEWGRPPPPPRDPGWGRPPGAPPHGPVLVIDFEPVLTRDLATSARNSLAVGFAAALALVLATLGLVRWLLEADAAALREAREARLRTLGEMSAVLAHEIRNPLASLKGHAQLLEEGLAPGKARDKAARVVLEAKRLERLSGDLLDFVRAGKVSAQEVDPRPLLREVAEAAGLPPEAVDLARAPARWSLDRDRLRQVLSNLLENARQAAPEGKSPQLGARQLGEVLLLTVRDHGPGLPDGDPEALFEPFHTTRVQGTGLGLAVVRRLVEAHGGTVRAGNHPGGGALFEVHLPRHPPEPEAES